MTKYFRNPESNLIFSSVIFVESSLNKLQKKFEDKEVSAENYIVKRREILEIANKFAIELEHQCKSITNKKPHKGK